MTVDGKEQRLAAACSVLLLAGAAAAAFIGTDFGKTLPNEYLLQAAALLLLSGLTAALAAIHAKLGMAAQEEERLESDRPAETLFADARDEAGRHQQGLRQFERVILPPTLTFFSIAELGLAFWIVRRLMTAERPPITDASALLPATSILIVSALLIFILGKYVAGLAFGAGKNYLRPVAGVTLLGAITAGLAAVASLAGYWTYPDGMTAAAWIMAALAGILAIERIALWLIDLYRPHAPGELTLPVYESRILALFSRPRGVLGNLSDVIEYQFGIRVDDNILARVLHRVLAPLVLVQLIALLALTSLVYVAPHQTAVLQQWGSTELSTLSPGLYVRLPWPASTVSRVDTGRISIMEIGSTITQKPEAEIDPSKPETWLDKRFTDDVRLTATESVEIAGNGIAVSLATVRFTLHHRISDPIAWVNNHNAPEQLLKQLAQRELGRLLLMASLREHVADGGRELSQKLERALQAATNNAELGVVITGIRFRNLQPPANVAKAWQEALSAKEQAAQSKLEAERFAVTHTAGISHQANAIVETARAETVRTSLVATADQKMFKDLRTTYRAFPKLYAARAKMDALERALVDKRKIIIATDPKNVVLEFDLKKARPDLSESLGESQ